jgi:hypothetical protein
MAYVTTRKDRLANAQARWQADLIARGKGAGILIQTRPLCRCCGIRPLEHRWLCSYCTQAHDFDMTLDCAAPNCPRRRRCN